MHVQLSKPSSLGWSAALERCPAFCHGPYTGCDVKQRMLCEVAALGQCSSSHTVLCQPASCDVEDYYKALDERSCAEEWVQDLLCAARHSRAAYGYAMAEGHLSSFMKFTLLQTVDPWPSC